MKKCALAVILLLISMMSFQCYYIREGVALLDVYSSGEAIDKALQRTDLAEEERTLLTRVKEIKQYAVTRFGLAENGNYTNYIRLKKDYLADIVSACDSVSFKQYLWDYLFVGKLPYQGFFNEAEAAAEARRLEHDGYDVYVRHVDAFSTLGVFSDPIFSFMKNYPSYALAELIFHEQAHATLFLSGQGTFNENFATFIGETGMQIYLQEKDGVESREYKIALALNHDHEAFSGELKSLYDELNGIYIQNITREEKIRQKTDAIEAWKTRYREKYREHFKTSLYQAFADQSVNNAVIMTYMNYTEKQDAMRELYELCGRDLFLFIKLARQLKDIKGTSEHPMDPVEEFRKLIETNVKE
jgi:predicted aminopeptidase